MPRVYKDDNGMYCFTSEDHLDDTMALNDIVTVYTSNKYANPVLESEDGTRERNPDFDIVETKVKAYEAAAHNQYDDGFGMYDSKENVIAASVRQLQEAGLSVDDLEKASNPAPAQSTPTQVVGAGVIFMDNVVPNNNANQPKPADPVSVKQEAAVESNASKPAANSEKSEKEASSNAVILKGVPVTQVFKTKRDGMKMVRVMDPGMPSGSFSFSATDNFIKANREGDKVVSYDVNIGLQGYYKEISYKDGDSYKKAKLDVQDIADKFGAAQQTFERNSYHTDAKPLYLNYIDRENVKEADNGKSTIYVPSSKSDDGLLRIQVEKNQVLMSKSNGAVIPGKFNIKLAGDAVHQAFYRDAGVLKELEGGITAKDLMNDYNAVMKQGRDRMKGITPVPEEPVRSSKTVQSQDVAQPADPQTGANVSGSTAPSPLADMYVPGGMTAAEPMKRSEAAKAKEAADETPVFNDLSSAMAFDGGFGM